MTEELKYYHDSTRQHKIGWCGKANEGGRIKKKRMEVGKHLADVPKDISFVFYDFVRLSSSFTQVKKWLWFFLCSYFCSPDS